MTKVDHIIENNIVTLDGGLGSELEKKHVEVNNNLWSASALIQNPGIVRDIHKSYFNAGAQLAITDTYQVHIPFPNGDQLRGYELIDLAVDLAKESLSDSNQRQESGLIAGSVGPYGAYLSNGAEYTGDYQLSQSEYKDFHRERVNRLVQDNVDVLLLETMPNFEEAKAVVDLISTEFSKIPIFLSFSTELGEHLWDGTSLKEVISYFNQNEQIRAIGVNCTAPENIIKALHNIAPYTEKKIIVYPNAGDTYDPISKRWVTDHGPINWSELVPTWYEAGACLIGGCCRTSPDDIYEINDAVQQLKKRTANINEQKR